MNKLIVHGHVDTDAIITACAAIQMGFVSSEADVHFLPADAERVPEEYEGALILDHQLGIKGEGAALSELPDIQEKLGSAIVSEVEQLDTSGSADPQTSLGEMFNAVRTYFRSKGMSGDRLDRKMIEWARPFVAGTMMNRTNRSVARAMKGDIPVVEIKGHKIAVPGRAMPEGSGEALNSSNLAEGAVYHTSYGLGVYRFPGRTQLDLSVLEEHLPGWFVHRRGYLACWGSRKAPQHVPPPAGTPQNEQELVALMREHLVERKRK